MTDDLTDGECEAIWNAALRIKHAEGDQAVAHEAIRISRRRGYRDGYQMAAGREPWTVVQPADASL